MPRQQRQHVLAVLHAAAGRQRVAEDDLRASVVQLGAEHEATDPLGIFDGPAGERARHFDHVLLGVAAIHAQRMQLEQLAAEVLVDAAARAAAALPQRGPLRLRRALPVVQVVQHGGTARHGDEQLVKTPQGVGTDHVAVEWQQQVTLRTLARIHREVVLPEVDHDFLELSPAHHRARQLGRLEISEQPAAGTLRLSQDERVVPGLEVRQGGRRAIGAGRHGEPWRRVAMRCGAQRGGARVELRRVGERERGGGEVRQHGVDVAIGDRVGLELPGDPPLHSNRPDRRLVARPGTERQAVEHVPHPLVGAERPHAARGRRDGGERGGGRGVGGGTPRPAKGSERQEGNGTGETHRLVVPRRRAGRPAA